MNKVSIIIPNINQKEFLEKCLKSIIQNTTIPYEIIVIDNGSQKQTRDWLLAQNIKTIFVPENIGFGRAINLAIKRCSGDIVILNNDTEVQKGWLKNFKIDDDTICGAIGIYPSEEELLKKYGNDGRKYFPSANKIQHGGAFINSYGNGQHLPFIPKELTEVEYVSFFCAYVPRKIINDVGLLDDDFYPAYYEDPAYCYEARKKGYKIVVNPKVIVTHYEGMGKKEHNLNVGQLNQTNRVKFFSKYKPDWTENKKYKISFVARITGELSYQQVVKNLATEIDKDKDFDVSLLPEETIYGGSISDWRVKKLTQKKFDPNRICIRYSEGCYSYLAYKRDIIYTTLETTSLPDDWVHQMNQFKQCWTPSMFCKLMFKKSGVKIPIFVIPHAVDPKLFYPRKKTSNKFTFFCNDMYGPRKNMDSIIKTFVNTFSKDEAQLLLHSSQLSNQLKQQRGMSLADYLKMMGNKGNIIINESWVKKEDIVKFYEQADVYIGMGSEGFGINFLEAQFMSIPIIAPAYGGVKDFCNVDNSLLVEGIAVPSYQPWLFQNYVNSMWFQPNQFKLREAMRYAYENQDKIKVLAEKGYKHKDLFLWSNIAHYAMEAIKRLERK